MYDWAVSIIEKVGYLGVALGMILENIFPPIPSELIMIFSGASAKEGNLNIFLVILVGSIGSVIGMLPWYYAGKWYGAKRLKKFANTHGRLLTLTSKDIDNSGKWFRKHGKKMVFFGRFLPGIRTLVAIPAAVTKMDLKIFLLWAFLGSVIWDGAFALIGYALGNQPELERYINIGTYTLGVIILVWYLYRVFTFRSHHPVSKAS